MPPLQRQGPWDSPLHTPSPNPPAFNPVGMAGLLGSEARPSPTHSPARPLPTALHPGRAHPTLEVQGTRALGALLPELGPAPRSLHRNRYPVRGAPCELEPKRLESKSGIRRRPGQGARKGARDPGPRQPATTLPKRPPEQGRRGGGDSLPRHAARRIGARAAGLGADSPPWMKIRCASCGDRDAHQRTHYQSLRGRRALPRGSCACS